MTIIQNAEVNRPVPDPLKSSILDHATVADIARFGLRNNHGMWPGYNCIDTAVPTPICPNPLLTEAGEFKAFDAAEWSTAFEFAVYGGVQCSAVGLDRADQEAEVERVFALNEGKAIEQALASNRFVERINGSGETGPEWEAPIDLTGDGMNLVGALAAVEGMFAALYAGVPTIHMTRAAALTLSGLGVLTSVDGIFYTKTGAKVAAGGGYDRAQALGSGTATIYGTGEVYIERSEEFEMQTHVMPGDGSGIGSGENGLENNTILTLAERMYRVAIDCNMVVMATGRMWGA